MDLEISWKTVTPDAGRPYRYPEPPKGRISQEIYGRPAVYRWCVTKPGLEPEGCCYIGETDNLFTRVRDYAYARPNHKQSFRVAQRLKARIANGQTVELQELQFPIFSINTEWIDRSHLSCPVRRR